MTPLSLRLAAWAFALLLFLPISQAWAQACGTTVILHVSPDGSSEATAGSSWDDPASLQQALSQANGNSNLSTCYELRLKHGLYTPTSNPAERTARFAINRPLRLRGGYTGHGDERLAGAQATVLSGDIDGNDANKTACGITPSSTDIVGNNSHHVVVMGGLGATANGMFHNAPGSIHFTLIERLTITAGKADFTAGSSFPSGNGGGLVCNGVGRDCGPRISQVHFLGNFAQTEGGALISQGAGAPLIENSLFQGNIAQRGGAFASMGLSGNNQPHVLASRFIENHTHANSGDGGAIFHMATSGITSVPRISNSLFRGNTAKRGGAIHNESVTGATLAPVFEGNTFERNQVGSRNWNYNNQFYGGAITNVARSNSSTTTTLTLHQNTFFQNSAEQHGGAIYNATFVGAKANLIGLHNTFLDNMATAGQAIFNQANNGTVTATLSDSILWGEGTLHQTSSGGSGSSTLSVQRSIVVPGGHTATETLNVDPLLSALLDHGGHTATLLPAANSPAINTVACNATLLADQRGMPRPQGSGATPCDMGAVEVSDHHLLRVQVQGHGIVTGPADLACGDGNTGICASHHAPSDPPQSVTLHAQPDPSQLVIWSGDCIAEPGNSLAATVIMSAAKHCQVVFAQGYTLQFDAQGGDPVASSHQLPGTTLVLPSTHREHHDFTGWNTAADGSGTHYAADAVFTFAAADATLYAQWQIHTYQVGASTSGSHGSIAADPLGVPLPLTIEHGDVASFILNVDAGYHAAEPFGGDCPSGTLTGSSYVTGPITGDCNVLVSFAINQYVVTFLNWEGQTLAIQIIAHGNPASAPLPPPRAGQVFIGWDTAFDVVTANLTIRPLYRPAVLDAALSKSVSHSLVLQDGSGDLVRFQILVTNVGDLPISDANVLDLLPDAFVPSSWTCEGMSGGICGNASGAGDIDEQVTLPVGAWVRYFVEGLVSPVPDAGILNTAMVDVQDDADTTNNTASTRYQRCDGINLQTDADDETLLGHQCIFQDNYETP